MDHRLDDVIASALQTARALFARISIWIDDVLGFQALAALLRVDGRILRLVAGGAPLELILAFIRTRRGPHPDSRNRVISADGGLFPTVERTAAVTAHRAWWAVGAS